MSGRRSALNAWRRILYKSAFRQIRQHKSAQVDISGSVPGFVPGSSAKKDPVAIEPDRATAAVRDA